MFAPILLLVPVASEAKSFQATLGAGYENARFESNAYATGGNFQTTLGYTFSGPSKLVRFALGPSFGYSALNGTKEKQKLEFSTSTVGGDASINIRITPLVSIATGLQYYKGMTSKLRLADETFDVTEYQRVCHPWNAVFGVSSVTNVGFGAAWCSTTFAVNSKNVSGTSRSTLLGASISRRI